MRFSLYLLMVLSLTTGVIESLKAHTWGRESVPEPRCGLNFLNGFMKDKAKQLEYTRQYYAAHKEQKARDQKRYYVDNKEKRSVARKKHYYKNRMEQLARMKVYRDANKDKRKVYDIKYYAENKSRLADAYRLRVYGIDRGAYAIMLKYQRNECAICGKIMQQVHVDHCHETGKVRGLLCINCNTALGSIGDSVVVLNKMIKYLLRA